MHSIVLAEEYPVTREGLRSLLERRTDFHVVASTGDGLRVCPLLEEHEPELLVATLDLPGQNGLNLLRKLQERERPLRIVLLSGREHPFFLQKARRLGASGYVLKWEPTAVLIEAVDTVTRGETYFTDDVSGVSGQQATGTEPHEALTEREREVLQLTAEAYTCAEIGERLGIGRRTVQKHREHLRDKLQADNVVELVRYVYQHGLLPGYTGRSE